MNKYDLIKLREKLKDKILWTSNNSLTEEQIFDNRALEKAIEVLKEEIKLINSHE